MPYIEHELPLIERVRTFMFFSGYEEDLSWDKRPYGVLVFRISGFDIRMDFRHGIPVHTVFTTYKLDENPEMFRVEEYIETVHQV